MTHFCLKNKKEQTHTRDSTEHNEAQEACISRDAAGNVYFFSFVLFCIFQVFYAFKNPTFTFTIIERHLYKKGTQLKDK